MPEMSGERVTLAVITAAHGIKGWVKVKSYTTDPSDLVAYGELCFDNGLPCYLTIKGEAKGQLLCAIKGVNDRSAAELLKGKKLSVSADAMPPAEDDEFYLNHLIGFAAITDGAIYGTISAYYDFGGGDILEIITATGAKELYIFTEANFPEIDMEKKTILFSPPEIIEAPKTSAE